MEVVFKNMILYIFLAYIGSLTSGVTFNIKGRKLVFAGFSGMIGFLAYTALYHFTGYLLFSIFVGAVAVGLFSETSARLLKAPSTVFAIPGILPLVPGIAAYEMIRYLIDNQIYLALGKMIEVSGGAGAIAFGILLVTAMFRAASRVLRSGKRHFNI